eukprot:TRINITY_DN596_c0_g1_i15.p1 TRINITY_DN596_c0_g1~~TRINITY_DN596_c0_g1_i15.p1  ORF type:complete len:273 (+),score=-16.02 TRINITY_DN596_c0_g1_i15:401-1219(+)
MGGNYNQKNLFSMYIYTVYIPTFLVLSVRGQQVRVWVRDKIGERCYLHNIGNIHIFKFTDPIGERSYIVFQIDCYSSTIQVCLIFDTFINCYYFGFFYCFKKCFSVHVCYKINSFQFDFINMMYYLQGLSLHLFKVSVIFFFAIVKQLFGQIVFMEIQNKFNYDLLEPIDRSKINIAYFYKTVKMFFFPTILSNFLLVSVETIFKFNFDQLGTISLNSIFYKDRFKSQSQQKRCILKCIYFPGCVSGSVVVLTFRLWQDLFGQIHLSLIRFT